MLTCLIYMRVCPFSSKLAGFGKAADGLEGGRVVEAGGADDVGHLLEGHGVGGPDGPDDILWADAVRAMATRGARLAGATRGATREQLEEQLEEQPQEQIQEQPQEQPQEQQPQEQDSERLTSRVATTASLAWRRTGSACSERTPTARTVSTSATKARGTQPRWRGRASFSNSERIKAKRSRALRAVLKTPSSMPTSAAPCAAAAAS
ncbi:hypothetical protein G6O67_004315 [Ophiocordyceps sinensis]|uniref:Uncharacterized protein n=1 Tax=Ophiocordyceps sinensis TaxID=72228 RepID=A0A8H4PNL0_9HYPO|nr:hypothetical protein G6O67_004315 [Ophiocordyceps sinensis]